MLVKVVLRSLTAVSDLIKGILIILMPEMMRITVLKGIDNYLKLEIILITKFTQSLYIYKFSLFVQISIFFASKTVSSHF